MKKRLTALLMALIMILDMASITVEAISGPYFSVSSQTVYPGNSTTVSVSGTDLSALGAVDLEIYYDSSALTLNSTSNGSLMGDAIADINTDTAGVIKLSAISLSGISGSGKLLNINFTANDSCPRGKYPVQVTVGDAHDTDLNHVDIAGGTGYITVEEKQVAQKTFYLNNYMSPYNVKKGDTVTCWVNNSNNYPFAAASFDIGYDPQILQVESVTVNSSLQVDGCVYDVNTDLLGKVKVGIASNVELNSYELISVVFRVIADDDITSSVSAAVSEVYADDLSEYMGYTTSSSFRVTRLPQVADYPDLTLSVQDMIVGKEYTSTLSLEEGAPVGAADFAVAFDNNVFEIISARPSAEASSKGAMLMINEKFDEGLVRFSYINTSGYKDGLDLIDITYRIKSAPQAHYTAVPSGKGVKTTDYQDIQLDYIPATSCIYGKTAVPPTCTQQGYTVYSCSCGESYNDDYVAETGHISVVDEAVKETCSSTGLTAGSHCSVCGEVFVAQQVIPKLPHTESNVVVENNILPDCVNDGSYDNVIYCTVCGEEISRENVVVNALGHTAGQTVVENNVDPDCVNDGSYDNVIYCTVCSVEVSRETVVVDALGHTLVTDDAIAPTCTATGLTQGQHCKVCGDILTPQYVVDALGHDYDNGVITTQPTCTEDGIKTFTCQNDTSHTYTEKVDALGHTAGQTVVDNNVPPTCENKGSYDNVVYCTVCEDELSRKTVTVDALGHTAKEPVEENRVEADCITDGHYDVVIYCSVCDKELSRNTETVEKLGHSFTNYESNSDATCTENGTETAKCDRCDVTDTREDKDSALGHNYIPTVTKPTCETAGYTTNDCSRCDDSFVSDHKNALGHDYDNGVITTQPTCTEDGVKTFTCQNDVNHTYTEKVDALGHTAGHTVVENNVPPTCEKKGSYDNVVYCTVCEDELSRENVVVNALGHTAGETVVENNVPPTCENKGSYDNVVYCTVCEDELSRETVVVNALGHSFTNYESNSDATCTANGTETAKCNRCDATDTRVDVDSALGHNYIPTVTNPTCETAGYTTNDCSRCDDSFVSDHKDALGHDYDNGVITTQPTCTEDGVKTFTCQNDASHTYTEKVDAFGHTAGTAVVENNVPPTCENKGSYDNVVYCTVCEDELSRKTVTVDALGHTAKEPVEENRVEADCITDGHYDVVIYCSVCDKELSRNTETVEKLGHSFTNYESNSDATCTANGTETAKCNRCDATETREDKDSALGHNYIPTVTKPTCETAGYTTNDCSRCDDSFVSEHKDALGHKYNAGVITTQPTCTEDGVKIFTCQNDANHTYTEKVDALGHTAGQTVVENNIPPTCENKGSYDNVVYCTVCEDELSRKTVTVDEIGHNYDNGVITTQPTCTEDGIKTFTCQNDTSHTYTEKVDALGHTAGETVVENNVPPTCENKGSYDNVVYCTVCEDELSRKTVTVNALGHTPSEPVEENRVEADCITDGHYDSVVYCSVCDKELSRNTETIEKLGHSFTDYILNGDGTKTAICDRCDVTETINDEIFGGDFSETFHWFIDSTNTLYIMGEGEIPAIPADDIPWKEHSDIIEKAVIAEEITNIPAFAFKDCVNLKNAQIPDGIKIIGQSAFENCVALEEIKIPLSTEIIGSNAFAGCENLDKVIYEGTSQQWDKIETDESFGGLADKDIAMVSDYSYTENADGTITITGSNISLEGNITIPDSQDGKTVTAIGENAFSGNDKITGIKIPETVKSIGSGAFENCGNITSIEIPPTVEFIGENAFAGISSDAEIYILNNAYAQEILKAMGFENVVAIDYSIAEITLNRDYLVAHKGESYTLTAQTTYPAQIMWSVEGDSIEIAPDGENCSFTATNPGTAYLVASATFGRYTVYARCRVDVTEDIPAATISGAHLAETSAVSKIYSTDYTQLNVHFDILQNQQNMMLMSFRGGNHTENTGLSIEQAYFTNENAKAVFDLRVIDDRTLEIIPKIDLNDSLAVKEVASSYKTQVTVVVDGTAYTTTETLSLKTDKKLPSVKVGSVKLNSFYTQHSLPLVFTAKNETAVSATVDESKATAKTPAIPEWLTLNDDMSVSLKPEFTGKASGKLYLNVMLEGWAVPVKVTASVSASSTAPKLKLSRTKAVFNAYRDKAVETVINLLSSDKKVAFDTINVTNVRVAHPSELTDKELKSYKVCENYAVTDYNVHTGAIAIDVANGQTAVSGKIMLIAEIAGSQQVVKLPVTVTAYTSAPSFKLEKTSATLYTPDAQTSDSISLKMLPTPADYLINADNFSWAIKNSKGVQLPADILDVSFADNTVTVKTNDNTPVGRYKVVFTLEEAAKTVTLDITVKAPTFKLEKSSVTLNTHYAQTSDGVTLKVVPTPADYLINPDNFSWIIQNSKGVRLPAETLDVLFADNTVTVKTNENTPVDKYKVVFKLREAEKTVTLSVTVKAAALKLSASSITLNKLLADSAQITLKPTPADYQFTDENITWTITDGKNNVLPADTLDISMDSSVVKVAVSDNTAFGATYKVKFRLTETGKETALTVKTLSQTSTAKVSLSVKGKLETGYPDKAVTVTAKWSNFIGTDIRENLKVYAKSSAKGAVAVDVTDKFDIVSNGGNTYTVRYKNLDAVNQLNHKDKYTVVAENMLVNGQSVADSKAATVSVAFAKAKVVQDVKSVKLYLNDRYSRGIVKLNLADSTLPAIAKVEIAESKISGYYSLKHLGNNMYAIGFKDNQINPLIKAGSLKLNIYLEGNNPANQTPNATASVTVSNVKFK